MISIRPEKEEDYSAIEQVTRAGFLDMPFAAGYEHLIPARLRDKGALSLSLVAEAEGRIIGHAAYSAVSLSDGTAGWYGLGPISVIPAHQRTGVGSRLIETGLNELKERGAAGCVVLGDPNYYMRHGFVQHTGLIYAGAPAAYFMAIGFAGPFPKTAVHFDPAFNP
ncbi:GNAT family N-acetyltransferase [Rhizobium sp. PAMB 3174]